MYSENTLLNLVQLIYDAAADPSRWPTFLRRYQELLAARNVALGYPAPSPEQMVVVATGADESDIQKYHRYPCPWLERLIQANWRTGGAGASHHLITDGELEKTTCFNEFLGPRRFHYGMGAAVVALGNTPATFVTLREKKKGPYSDDDLVFLRTLLPHVSKALQLYGRIVALESTRDALADSLDQLATAVVLVDDRGSIVFASRPAWSILRAEDGIRAAPDGLAAALPRETSKLRQLIRQSILTTQAKGLHPGGALLLSRPSLRRSLAVAVSPVPNNMLIPGLPASIAAAVFISDPEHSVEPDAALLARLYGLTPAETRVAVALLGGKALPEAAEELGISYHTVRTQAKSIFAKTGTRGQSELVRLLLTLPARRLAAERLYVQHQSSDTVHATSFEISGAASD